MRPNIDPRDGQKYRSAQRQSPGPYLNLPPHREVLTIVDRDELSRASEEELATLLKLTERYCIALQTLTSAPEITARIEPA